MNLRARLAACAPLVLVAAPAAAQAQIPTVPSAPDPLTTAALLALLGLAPLVLVVTTSFAKFVVVLSLLRTALVTPSVPPAIVVTSLALVLSAMVMAPVAEETWRAAEPAVSEGRARWTDLDTALADVEAAATPLRRFLAANAGEAELAAVAELQGRDVGDDPLALPLVVVAPAFALTELAEAFQIGFLLFLPFLVLDLLVGSVLMSLGMHMLSPTTVSTPFKLLLFVLVEGWLVLSQSLVLGYTYPGGA